MCFCVFFSNTCKQAMYIHTNIQLHPQIWVFFSSPLGYWTVTQHFSVNYYLFFFQTSQVKSPRPLYTPVDSTNFIHTYISIQMTIHWVIAPNYSNAFTLWSMHLRRLKIKEKNIFFINSTWLIFICEAYRFAFMPFLHSALVVKPSL